MSISGLAAARQSVALAERPNFLLIAADDLSADSLGCFGCAVPETSPHLDRFAWEGVRFEHAHVNVAVCVPSRATLMTGRYPHNHGAFGFEQVYDDVPTLNESFRAAGYVQGIIDKRAHSTVKRFVWDYAADSGVPGGGRYPENYGPLVRDFAAHARAAGRPFFLMVNSHDPHRPFHGDPAAEAGGAARPSRVYAAEEVRVPGFLPDIPVVRADLARYYNCVRRLDDTVGSILRGLDASGETPRTVVVFLSDHGMPFPFAKTNCYRQSTRSPWIVRWPGVSQAGLVVRDHMVSGVDLMPTLLEIAGAPPPPGVDGRSFVALLRGRGQFNREHVFTQFHEGQNRLPFPMRCVNTRRYGYIFNAWSNGTRRNVENVLQGPVFDAIVVAGERDNRIQQRLNHLLYRSIEELYDYDADPDALHNVIGRPEYEGVANTLRAELACWMEDTRDPALGAYLDRHDPAVLEGFMLQEEARSLERGRDREIGRPRTEDGEAAQD